MKKNWSMIFLVGMCILTLGVIFMSKMMLDFKQEAYNTAVLRETTCDVNHNVITINMYPAESCLKTMKEGGITEHFKYSFFPRGKYVYVVNIYEPKNNNSGSKNDAAYTLYYEKELFGSGDDEIDIKLN